MGLRGQPVIIVLMDQHKSETTQSSVHSRSELRQGQCSELEPGLSELGRFRINALGFLFFFFFQFFSLHMFYLISSGWGEIENRLAVRATQFSEVQQKYWLSTVCELESSRSSCERLKVLLPLSEVPPFPCESVRTAETVHLAFTLWHPWAEFL